MCFFKTPSLPCSDMVVEAAVCAADTALARLMMMFDEVKDWGKGFENCQILRTNSTGRLREMWTKGRDEVQKSPKFCGLHMYMATNESNDRRM